MSSGKRLLLTLSLNDLHICLRNRKSIHFCRFLNVLSRNQVLKLRSLKVQYETGLSDLLIDGSDGFVLTDEGNYHF